MPQLNILPVNVSKNIELKDELAPFDSTTSKNDFSKYIDLHLIKNKEAESNSKVDSVKSEVIVAKNSKSPTESTLDTKKPDDLVENIEISDETDSASLVQKLAASGNNGQIKSNNTDQKALLESEQLMLFLSKADNTLINQSVDTSSISSPEQGSEEQKAVEQKARDETQLLLNSSNLVADLSAVAKALGNDQADSAEELLLNHAVKEKTGKESTSVKLPVESLIEIKNKDNTQAEVPVALVKSAEKQAVLAELKAESTTEAKVTNISSDKRNKVLAELKAESTTEAKVTNISSDNTNKVLAELKVESTTEAKVTNISSDKTNKVLAELKVESTTETKVTNVSSNKTNTSQQMPNQTLPLEATVDRALVTKNNEDISLTAEQKMAKQIKSDHAQISNEKTSQNGLPKEMMQSRDGETLSHSQLSENENTESQSNNKNQTQSDAVKSLEKRVGSIETQVNPSKQIQAEKISSLPDSQLIKSEVTQSSEVTTTNEKANQAAVHLNKTVLSSNQPATSVLNHDDVSKTQVKQDEKALLSASLAEQSQQKLVAQPLAQNEDEILVENKVIASTKIEPSANRHFIDVSGKVTQTPQHIIDQQSAEMFNPSVATEVTQSQKTNVQLHQETISMFRKDFTEAVKDKVMLMISQKLQQFDITLDPPELGNMQVRVNLQGEQAVVSFLVQSQQTKDALEQNMHKLRELLAEQGVDVGDANVEQQSQQSANEEGSTGGNNSQMQGEIDNMADVNDVVAHTLSAQMLDSSTATVDYYA